MKNKKKLQKVLIYLLSGLIPLSIFALCTIINKFIPYGGKMLNIYDSFYQYSGFMLTFGRLLKKGMLFYSWNAGLGFNFLGTITYYLASPLNWLSIFTTETNYPYFVVSITYLRFFLLGLSMCFYLSHKKNIKPLYIVLFSTIYALMGYTSTYYYNYLWIDSIIMLPLVIYGLDKLIDENKSAFYIFTLAFTILINYYIGYMICIFLVIYFIYKIVSKENKKEIIKRFIISSLFAGLIGALSIIPSYFALKTGKATLYETSTYAGFEPTMKTFFYTILPGSYQAGDQEYGPAIIYSSILALVLSILYFFNTNFSKKQKITTGLILLFFYMSFSISALNYAWQFFQKPIWWQSRFSFVFSFFLINLAVETLINIDKTKIKNLTRIIISIIFFALAGIGAYFKLKEVKEIQVHTYFFMILSIMFFLETIFLVDKKGLFYFVAMVTILDLGMNTFNSTKQNVRYNSLSHYSGLRENFPKKLEELNNENEYFYRFEMMSKYTSNDGLYFGYNGINYFNSVRNIKVINLFENLGQNVVDKCHLVLSNFDPAILSLFNIKYLSGELDYYKKIDSLLYENPYPLSIGFIANKDIKDLSIKKSLKYVMNVEKIYDSLLGEKSNLYIEIPLEDFTMENVYYDRDDDSYKYVPSNNSSEGFINYSFTSDNHYLIITSDNNSEIYVNGNKQTNRTYKSYVEINKNDEVTIKYEIYTRNEKESMYLYLLDLNRFERIMEVLGENTWKAKENINHHIIEGDITVTKDDAYLFTSIEYEKGMRVYVDGKLQKIDILLDSLIGFELPKGDHHIYITYIPNGLILGSIISGIGLISTCLYLQKNKKKL